MCCSVTIGSTGCQVAKQQLQDGRKENLEGFMKTFDKELPEDAQPRVYTPLTVKCSTPHMAGAGMHHRGRH